MAKVALRLGIDLGGTKISGVVLDAADAVLAYERVATPQGAYAATLQAIAGLVRTLEQRVGVDGLPVGVGHPGALSPATGRIKNANSTWLNGQPLQRDLAAMLGRTVILANDANCLATSELRSGAAAGCSPVFAAILGTGVGGALAIDGRVVRGAQAIAGEWGHNPLPWTRAEWNECPGPRCWCGRSGCIETWLSGVGLAADYVGNGGASVAGQEVVARASAGEAAAVETLMRYAHRLARALAHVINLVDPEVIVLGGGLSRITRLYDDVPRQWREWVFSEGVGTRLVPAAFGADSGVRGAAALAAD